MDKLPWFPFYGRDFYGDENVKLFTARQLGMYQFLLWHQWEHGSVPSVEVSLFFPLIRAELYSEELEIRRQELNQASSDAKIMEYQVKEEVEGIYNLCFCAHKTDINRFYNPRLEEVREEQRLIQDANQRRGSNSAKRKRQLRDACHEHVTKSSRTSEMPVTATNQNHIQSHKQIQKKSKKDAPLHTMPNDWTLTDPMREFGVKKGMTPLTTEHEFEHCKTHHAQKQWTEKGWTSQVWQTWVLNWISFGRKQITALSNSVPKSFQKLDTTKESGEDMPEEVRALLTKAGRGKGMPA